MKLRAFVAVSVLLAMVAACIAANEEEDRPSFLDATLTDNARSVTAVLDEKSTAAIEEALHSDDRRARCDAALALAKRGDKRGLPILIQELEDKALRPADRVKSNGMNKQQGTMASDRYYAARLLGFLGDKGAVPSLTEALKDDAVNAGAAVSLGEIGDKSAIPALLQMAKDFPGRRLSAGYGLAILGEPEGFALLAEEALSGSDGMDRRRAVEALGTIGDPRGLPTLVKALKDEDWDVRVSAIHALTRIDDPAALPALNEALNSATIAGTKVPAHFTQQIRSAIEAIEAKTK